MVACNATNSAAIDYEGNIWVWGSGKYGLLGDHIKDVNYQVPKPLYLTTSGISEEEVSARDAFTREDQLAKYKVKDVSIGQYHMIVVAVDSEMHDQFTQLDYASDIFASLRDYLINKKFPKLGAEAFSKSKLEQINDRDMIEISLKAIFAQDKYRWPLAKWLTLYNLLFKELGIQFSENIITTVDQLQSDLTVTSDKQFINLKELRDQILGKRDNTNVVFGWGLNDERLCAKSNPADRAHRYMRCKVLGSLTDKKVTRVATGNSFSLALTQNGDVYSWGIGKSGSLGLGEILTVVQYPTKLIFRVRNDDTINITDPEQASQLQSEQIIAIESGQTHCLALTAENEVYSWGNGQGGRLGHGDSIGQNIPEKIKYLKGIKIVDIACGDQHSGCITEEGSVYVWGVGLNGRLGIGMDVNREVPTIVTEFNLDPCFRLFFGMNTSFAITKSSELYVWGSGQQGKIGMPNTLEQQLLVPRRLFTLSSKRIAEFAPGPFHTLALTYDGFIYAFGNSKEGKLGINLRDQVSMSMNNNIDKELNNFVLIPTVLTNAPKFYIQGELLKIFKTYTKFKKFTSEGVVVDEEGAKSLKVLQTACGDNNSYFLLNSGVIYATGANDTWQCSKIEEALKEFDLIEDDYLRPQMLSEKEIAERGGVAIPEEAAAIISQFQTMQQIDVPYPVEILKDLVNTPLPIKHISAGTDHVLAVSNTGQCFGWGDNSYAQLGIGILPSNVEQDNHVSKPTFLKLLSDKKILMTAAGKYHSLFLTELGHVYSAGLNESGQLGIKSDPMQIKKQAEYNISILQNYLYQKTKSKPCRVDIENVRFIAAGDQHSLAITDSSVEGNFESKLYSWGWSAYGQLGHIKIKNYYNLDRPKKVKFVTQYQTKVAFVSAGSKQTVCIDTDGKLWYFGDKNSVGIRSQGKKYQFYPAQLVPENRDEASETDYGLLYVDCNKDENLVISSDNSVFAFGARTSERRTVKAEYDEHGSDSDPLDEAEIGFDTNPQHKTYFKRVIRKDRVPLKADYISKGSNHSVAIEHEKTVPFAWGDNTSGQLGLGQHPTRTFFVMPNPIEKLASLIESKEASTMQFQQIMRQANSTSTAQNLKLASSKSGPTMQAQQILQSRYRWPIQVELKKQAMVPSTQSLLKADIKLISQFNKLVEDFSIVCKGVGLSQSTMTTRAQDGIITRVLKFPTPFQGHNFIQSTIPKSISKNRQIFEAIFLQLQAHPCYLVNWIQGSRFFDQPKDIVTLFYAIFGKREMKDNNRVLNTLMIIAKKMFDAEASINNFKELCSVYRTDSPFRTIFKLIYGMQSTNLGFNKQIIFKLLYKLQQVYTKIVEDEATEYDLKVENQMIQEIFLFVLDVIRKKIEFIGGDDVEKAQQLKGANSLSIQVLTLLDYAYQQLVQIAQQGIKAKSMKESRKKPKKQSDDEEEEEEKKMEEDAQEDWDMPTIEKTLIFPYLLDLLFEDLLDVIESLTYEEINFEYWDYKMTQGAEPIYDLFGPVEGDSYLKKLTKYIKMYFRQQSTNVPADFQELITSGQISFRADRHLAIRSLTQTNFREKMAFSLFTQSSFKPLNLDFTLVQQLFSTCTEITNATLAATVQDIIFVYNSIISEMELICQSDFQNDPLRVLVRQLGGQPIKLAVKEENLRMRINLQINARFLYSSNEIVKCRYCYAPVTSTMIPRDRFMMALKGTSWRCQAKNCTKQNPPGVFQCTNCSRPIPIFFAENTGGTPRSARGGFSQDGADQLLGGNDQSALAQGQKKLVPTNYLGKDLVFKRFVYKPLEQAAKLFKFVLKTLPLIEDNQDVYSLIEQELEKQPAQKTRAEFNKQEKLSRFKEMIEEYSQRENRNIFAVMSQMGVQIDNDNKGVHKMQLLLAEKDFLEGLSREVIDQIDAKKAHQKLLKDYQQSLVKINLLTPLLKQRTTIACQSLEQILYGSYIGICSPFLKEQIEKLGGNFKKKETAAANANDPSAGATTKTKERIWAGSLHIETKELGKKQKKKTEKEEIFSNPKTDKYKKKSKNDIITEYFAEITTKKALSLRWDPSMGAPGSESPDKSQSTQAGANGKKLVSETPEDEERKRQDAESEEVGNQIIAQAINAGSVGKARAISGQLQFAKLIVNKVIKKADSERYDSEILKFCQLSFNDNLKGGLQVDLVYKEPRSAATKFAKMDGMVLENFEITRETLLEMRRNFANHSTIIFGMLQFRVYYLIQEINEIVAMNNIFSTLQLDENGYRVVRQDEPALKPEGTTASKGISAGLRIIEEEQSDADHDAKGDQKQNSKGKKGKGGGAAAGADDNKSSKKKDQKKKK